MKSRNPNGPDFTVPFYALYYSLFNLEGDHELSQIMLGSRQISLFIRYAPRTLLGSGAQDAV